MIAVSLKLPKDLAEESKRLAEQIGISRTELIRQALQHELDRIKRQMEREAMAASFRAMRQSEEYLKETETLDEELSESWPDEAEIWWKT
jgi:metal-responsive CopG/Arc/MetJ family transcriptional regulator